MYILDVKFILLFQFPEKNIYVLQKLEKTEKPFTLKER